MKGRTYRLGFAIFLCNFAERERERKRSEGSVTLWSVRVRPRKRKEFVTKFKRGLKR